MLKQIFHSQILPIKKHPYDIARLPQKIKEKQMSDEELWHHYRDHWRRHDGGPMRARFYESYQDILHTLQKYTIPHGYVFEMGIATGEGLYLLSELFGERNEVVGFDWQNLPMYRNVILADIREYNLGHEISIGVNDLASRTTAFELFTLSEKYLVENIVPGGFLVTQDDANCFSGHDFLKGNNFEIMESNGLHLIARNNNAVRINTSIHPIKFCFHRKLERVKIKPEQVQIEERLLAVYSKNKELLKVSDIESNKMFQYSLNDEAIIEGFLGSDYETKARKLIDRAQNRMMTNVRMLSFSSENKKILQDGNYMLWESDYHEYGYVLCHKTESIKDKFKDHLKLVIIDGLVQTGLCSYAINLYRKFVSDDVFEFLDQVVQAILILKTGDRTLFDKYYQEFEEKIIKKDHFFDLYIVNDKQFYISLREKIVLELLGNDSLRDIMLSFFQKHMHKYDIYKLAKASIWNFEAKTETAIVPIDLASSTISEEKFSKITFELPRALETPERIDVLLENMHSPYILMRKVLMDVKYK